MLIMAKFSGGLFEVQVEDFYQKDIDVMFKKLFYNCTATFAYFKYVKSRSRDINKRVEELENLIQRFPDFIILHFYLAKIYVFTENHVRALEEWLIAYKLQKPDGGSFSIEIAVAYSDLGNKDKAVEYCKIFLESKYSEKKKWAVHVKWAKKYIDFADRDGFEMLASEFNVAHLSEIPMCGRGGRIMMDLGSGIIGIEDVIQQIDINFTVDYIYFQIILKLKTPVSEIREKRRVLDEISSEGFIDIEIMDEKRDVRHKSYVLDIRFQKCELDVLLWFIKELLYRYFDLKPDSYIVFFR